jgi:outer membrane receptor protein involved in Fe transport
MKRRWFCSVVAASLLVFAALLSNAQAPYEVHGQVTDATGTPVAGATILLGGVEAAKTDADGRFAVTLTSATSTLKVVFGGFQMSASAQVGTDLHLVLLPQTVEQSATVTATRSSVEMGIVAATVETLSSAKLTEYPALTLDERLRQHAGFELFRRSSSWVANPTSEGISLRGLGSTAASRTLVLSDLVPLNDGFGGWIHWNEQPPETIDAVTLASGGGSDLYGSSAVGGVIDIVPSRPGPVLASVDIAGASEDTTNYSGRTDLRQGATSALLAAQGFRTAGYTIVAPSIRGKVDVPSNVHYQNGRFELARMLPKENRPWLTGNLLNEAHGNGTPIQTNATRLWRYIAGDDWKADSHVDGRVRGYGSDEGYRQSFSSINAARSIENLTRLQRVRTQEFGVSTDAAYHLEHVSLIAGGDLRDLRATDFETPYSAGSPTGIQDTSARQRFYGGFGEVVAERHGWSGALSLRGDEAANLDTNAIVQSGTKAPALTHTADRHEAVLSPRLGISKQLPASFELHASVFRAFRTPTMNELYRTGQVGQQTTLANSALLSERATGVEGGVHWASPRKLAALQATYFWTEINRPVSTVFQSGTATSTILLRENLGQIQSQGAALGAQLQPGHGLTLDFGYQYAHAVVTAFRPQPTLVGLWIPDVPRHTATGQLRYQHGPASFTLAARQSGRAFDDSANTFELHSFFVLDAYAEYRVRSHVCAYLSFQNLLNRSIETARTPNLTLGTPFVAQGGVRLNWGRN